MPGLLIALAGGGLLWWSVSSGSKPVEGLERGGVEWLVPAAGAMGAGSDGTARESAGGAAAPAGTSGAGAMGDGGSGGAAGAAASASPAAAEAGVVVARDDASAERGAALLIDINVATAAQFQLLPQIGPTLAQRIVDDRAANGRFSSVQDLMRVRGIGPKTVEQVEGLVVCGQ